MPKLSKAASIEKRALEVFQLRDEGAAKYAEAEKVLKKLRKRVGLGKPFLVEGVRYEVRDVFKGVDVVFRSHGIHRLELKKVKAS